MPSLRVPVPVFDTLIAVRGRFFQARANAPTHAQIPTVIPKCESAHLPRFPGVEILLGTQTVVHDCWVTVNDDRSKQHRFFVSCTLRPQVTINYALRSRFPDLPPWSGELVIMAIGSKNRVVGLRGEAKIALADAAVRTFLLHVQTDLATIDGLNWSLEIPTDI
ncbi:hypothetical protein OF83DRAFT_1174814 [Amylostereum chailletii]|nr:hypothetical protein OF83DRAFT_1174814 [Amylostereum chailletii]